ncbi:lipid-A-disaccharide synthase [Roseimaritima ulvae]|uniref:Lipid-A-disaccharide synthase n=1 Tax=Roseimaritima ulvae TaxID=980254 RepID=A0A5B9QMB6_9BACT|nr:lipid-A-disaccharide synthase [Roseimaritima ulvae]QEG38770.1 Glycosyl transferase [Roseimaritima ulvae]
MTQQLFFSVGEPSGDQHCARLIQALSQQHAGLQLRGFGGPEMQRAGCQLDHDLTQMAVMGVVEVLPKLRQFFRLADQAEAVFASGQVDAVLLADFPGFNWHIAKRAKKYNLPVYYYLPPQLWAWAPWRIRKLRRTVDKVLSVLPFECEWYQQRGVNAECVGHPFFDAVAEQQLDAAVIDSLTAQIRQGQRLVAVLPGSRQHEVTRNWPVMLEAIRRLSKQYPDARFLVAAFKDKQCLWCRDQLTATDRALPIDFFVGKSSEIIEMAECGMMVSGSVSLEMMARGTPAPVIYRVGRVFYGVGRMMVRVPSMTLPNLIAGETIFPEHVSCGSPESTVQFLHRHVDAMLGDALYRERLDQKLGQLRSAIAQPGASQRAAATVLNEMGIALPPAVAA